MNHVSCTIAFAIILFQQVPVKYPGPADFKSVEVRVYAVAVDRLKFQVSSITPGKKPPPPRYTENEYLQVLVEFTYVGTEKKPVAYSGLREAVKLLDETGAALEVPNFKSDFIWHPSSQRLDHFFSGFGTSNTVRFTPPTTKRVGTKNVVTPGQVAWLNMYVFKPNPKAKSLMLEVSGLPFGPEKKTQIEIPLSEIKKFDK